MCNLIFSLRARWLYDMNMEVFLCICALARFFAICMFKADGGYCSEFAIRGEIGLKCVCFGNNEAFAKRAGFFCKCLIYWYIILLFFSHLLCSEISFFPLTVCKTKKTFSKPNFILFSKNKNQVADYGWKFGCFRRMYAYFCVSQFWTMKTSKEVGI